MAGSHLRPTAQAPECPGTPTAPTVLSLSQTDPSHGPANTFGPQQQGHHTGLWQCLTLQPRLVPRMRELGFNSASSWRAPQLCNNFRDSNYIYICMWKNVFISGVLRIIKHPHPNFFRGSQGHSNYSVLQYSNAWVVSWLFLRMVSPLTSTEDLPTKIALFKNIHIIENIFSHLKVSLNFETGQCICLNHISRVHTADRFLVGRIN